MNIQPPPYDSTAVVEQNITADNGDTPANMDQSRRPLLESRVTETEEEPAHEDTEADGVIACVGQHEPVDLVVVGPARVDDTEYVRANDRAEHISPLEPTRDDGVECDGAIRVGGLDHVCAYGAEHDCVNDGADHPHVRRHERGQAVRADDRAQNIAAGQLQPTHVDGMERAEHVPAYAAEHADFVTGGSIRGQGVASILPLEDLLVSLF